MIKILHGSVITQTSSLHFVNNSEQWNPLHNSLQEVPSFFPLHCPFDWSTIRTQIRNLFFLGGRGGITWATPKSGTQAQDLTMISTFTEPIITFCVRWCTLWSFAGLEAIGPIWNRFAVEAFAII